MSVCWACVCGGVGGGGAARRALALLFSPRARAPQNAAHQHLLTPPHPTRAARRHQHTTNSYVQDYDEKDAATHKGLDLSTLPTAGLYQHFGLDPQTIDFIGHAIALHRCACVCCC